MRLKSLSDNSFLYVSLAFRHASIVAVTSVLTVGDAARLKGLCCPSTGSEVGLLELGLKVSDEDGCAILN